LKAISALSSVMSPANGGLFQMHELKSLFLADIGDAYIQRGPPM
jgi:hypothetical protein